jgi:chemotaxis signal transduction protein
VRDVRDEVDRLVVFNSGPMLFGLDLDLVQEVVAACEISPLPDGPTPVAGIVTIDAQVMAVVDPKRHFAPDGVSQPAVDTRFLLVQSPVGTIAIMADAVEGVRDVLRSTLKGAEQLVSGMSLLRDFAATVGGLIYIFDPKHLLSPADAASLEAALARLQS